MPNHRTKPSVHMLAVLLNAKSPDKTLCTYAGSNQPILHTLCLRSALFLTFVWSHHSWPYLSSHAGLQWQCHNKLPKLRRRISRAIRLKWQSTLRLSMVFFWQPLVHNIHHVPEGDIAVACGIKAHNQVSTILVLQQHQFVITDAIYFGWNFNP